MGGVVAFARLFEACLQAEGEAGSHFVGALALLAKQIERNRRRFISKAQGVVNGKLVFETTITGMTF